MTLKAFCVIVIYLINFTMPKTPAMPSGRKGMKLKTLPIREKVKILDRIDSGASMQMVSKEFQKKCSKFYFKES